MYCEIWKTKPSAAAINSILVPPKLKNGNVIPVNGISPIIAAILIVTCDEIHPKTPAAKKR